MTRVIAVTGAEGREEKEEGGCTGRMLRREARISSLPTVVRMKDERGRVGGWSRFCGRFTGESVAVDAHSAQASVNISWVPTLNGVTPVCTSVEKIF